MDDWDEDSTSSAARSRSRGRQAVGGSHQSQKSKESSSSSKSGQCCPACPACPPCPRCPACPPCRCPKKTATSQCKKKVTQPRRARCPRRSASTDKRPDGGKAGGGKADTALNKQKSDQGSCKTKGDSDPSKQQKRTGGKKSNQPQKSSWKFWQK